MHERPKPDGERSQDTAEPRGRRPYVAPALTEYGSIGKLTQGGSGSVGEGSGGMSMPMCL
jgi:hypothetical protein